jgi:hypothetical protein
VSKKKTDETPAETPKAEPFSVKSDGRAANSVRRARSRVALAGFVLALVAGLSGGAAAWDAVARALLAGVVGWYVGWAAALTVWRHVLVAEARAELARHRAPETRAEPPLAP